MGKIETDIEVEINFKTEREPHFFYIPASSVNPEDLVYQREDLRELLSDAVSEGSVIKLSIFERDSEDNQVIRNLVLDCSNISYFKI